jgi:hyperosmotically inducible protein
MVDPGSPLRRTASGGVASRTFGALALVALLANAGCLPDEPDFEGTVVTLVSADAALAERVEQVLAAERPPLGGVVVSVANGVVALSGRVPTDAERERAERAARRVDGVREVRNELAVVAAPPALGALRAPWDALAHR